MIPAKSSAFVVDILVSSAGILGDSGSVAPQNRILSDTCSQLRPDLHPYPGMIRSLKRWALWCGAKTLAREIAEHFWQFCRKKFMSILYRYVSPTALLTRPVS